MSKRCFLPGNIFALVALLICLTNQSHAQVNGAPATKEQLLKACGAEIRAARAGAIANAKERYEFFRAKPDQLSPAQIAEAIADARRDLASASNKKQSDVDWFMATEESISERHSVQRLRDDVARLSDSGGVKMGEPMTVGSYCGKRAQLAALEGRLESGSPPQASSSGRLAPSGSAALLASCTDEIKRVQLESQSWSGNVDDVAARLGRFQKDLFEGRCSSHPDAQAYINGANKMLAYGGNPAGSSGGTTATATAPLAPIRRDTQSKEHNPAHNASTCIKVYGPADMKAHGLKSIMNSMLVNTCPYNVSVMWCIEPGNGHAGDCSRGYSNTWDLSAAGKQGSTWGIPADGQMVQYAACRHGPNMGFQPVEADPRFPYRFSCS